MKTLALGLAVGLFGLTAVASADAIQKWRSPDGSLYFGDHPPSGSTLLMTYPEAAAPSVMAIATDEIAELSRAAADGRDIIRRREEERAADRRAEEEREERRAEIEAQSAYDSPPFWFITTTRAPCRFGERCFDRPPHRHRHHDDFSPGGGFRRPSGAGRAPSSGTLVPRVSARAGTSSSPSVARRRSLD